MSYRGWKRAYARGRGLKRDREALEQTRKEKESKTKQTVEEKTK